MDTKAVCKKTLKFYITYFKNMLYRVGIKGENYGEDKTKKKKQTLTHKV